LADAQVTGPLKGVDVGPVQGFVRVDVAQPGQGPLIQQQGLDLPAESPYPGNELLWGNLHWLRAKSGDLWMFLQLGRFGKLYGAELALISVAELVVVVGQMEDEMGVFDLRHVGWQVEQLSAHAQVHQKAASTGEVQDDQLAPASDTRKALPPQTFR